LNLLEDNIYTLIRKIALPASIGFVFITLFNVVDTYFAGNHISSEALAGMTFVFPMHLIMMAFGAGIYAGTTVLSTEALGQQNKAKVIQLLYNAFLFTIVISFLLGIFVWFTTKPIIILMGATQEALEAGVSYMHIIALSTPFFMGGYFLNTILTIQGDTKSFRNAVILSFFINIGLNALFILYFDWGVDGLAFATFIVTIISFAYMLFKVRKSKLFYEFAYEFCVRDKIMQWKISKQGLPAVLNMLIMSLQLFIMNSYVDFYAGQHAVAGMGAAFRVEQLIILPTIALNIAAMTIMGYNYGAKNIPRIIETFKAITLIGLSIVAIGILLILAFGDAIIMFFDSTPTVVSFGSRYLQVSTIVLLSYVLVGSATATLQSLQKPLITLGISFFRRIVLTLLFFTILTTYFDFGIDGILYALMVLPWIGALLFFILLQKTIHKKKIEFT